MEVSRRKQYKDGEVTDSFDTVYKVLINYEPIEIKVDDNGSIIKQSDAVIAYKEAGTPLKVSFENCLWIGYTR